MALSSSKIDLTPSHFTKREIRYEIPAILTNLSVKVLHLPTDRLDEASTKCITMLLERDDVGPQIEELRLFRTQNETSGIIDKDGPLIQIVHSLKHTTQIKKLVISEMVLNPYEVLAISSILYDVKSLSTLVLRQCGIEYKGCTKISCALASNTSVESFDFSNNPIGNRGASSLAVALEINSSMKKLKLSGTHLGIEGAIAVASVIASNSSLEVLDLSRNSIGDMGTSKIALALKSNKTLRQLSLRENSLSDVGALCVLLALFDSKNMQAVLNCNHSLRYVNLNNNEVGRKSLLDIEDARRMNLLETEKETIRHKIAFFLHKDLQTYCFGDEMSIKCMPYLVSAIGKTGSVTALFKVLKNTHMPAMFESKLCTGCADSIFSAEHSITAQEKDSIPSYIQVEGRQPSSPL